MGEFLLVLHNPAHVIHFLCEALWPPQVCRPLAQCVVPVLVSALISHEHSFVGLFPSLDFDLGTNAGTASTLARPWKSYLSSLSLRFLPCKMGIRIPLSLGYFENQVG